jgi:predicted GNAT family N-acyltransferase
MLSKARANTSFTLQTGPWPLLREGASAVRIRVFIDEQGIDPRLEWDDDDATALHALVWCDGMAVGTARLLASQAGVARIGRMAVLAQHRGQGLGARLLDSLLRAAHARGDHTAVLHAQCTATEFYRRAGFMPHGEHFIEAGIEHIEMNRPLRSDLRADRQEAP